MEVLVFKTNIESRNQVLSLYPLFKKIQGILRWNIDLQDIDHVLRVETVTLTPTAIEAAMQQAGYFCKELE